MLNTLVFREEEISIGKKIMIFMELPFIEEEISQGYFLRKFSGASHDSEFVWHRDKEDRYVLSCENTDWMLQLDDQLPMSLNEVRYIPKETYHRLIKGSGDLDIVLLKIK